MPEAALYLAGPDGFTEAGRLHHDRILVPKILSAGFRPLDPWASVDDHFGPALLISDHAARTEELSRVNHLVGQGNVKLIDQADALLANLDGIDVDSGTAAEIGYAAARGIPIAGFRTDQRSSGENDGASINLQVEYFIRASGGSVHCNLDDAIADLRRLVS